MPRYFLELRYKGGAYSGFQKQAQESTVQSEVEKALHILYKQQTPLTGSSRTDAGVHALQNFFHFDTESELDAHNAVYRLNALLPADIAVQSLTPVNDEAHCRFAATARSYEYHIYHRKNPFLADRSYFYPYRPDIGKLNEAAALLFRHTDFTSFSKRNTQVKTFYCHIKEAFWQPHGGELVFHVTANRFLRGMVRGLTGTMLKVGRGILSLEDFEAVIEARDCRRADFSVPPQGLFLTRVHYPETVWKSAS